MQIATKDTIFHLYYLVTVHNIFLFYDMRRSWFFLIELFKNLFLFEFTRRVVLLLAKPQTIYNHARALIWVFLYRIALNLYLSEYLWRIRWSHRFKKICIIFSKDHLAIETAATLPTTNIIKSKLYPAKSFTVEIKTIVPLTLRTRREWVAFSKFRIWIWITSDKLLL